MSQSPLDATVAVLGFGNQGHAHAQNLRDSNVSVIVGARPGYAGESRARALGFESLPLEQAAAQADVVAVMLPDELTPRLWPALASQLRPGATVVFAHGFNLLYGGLGFPDACDVVLVSPTGPGRVLRSEYVAGRGLPAYLAVHQDHSGHAFRTAEAYGVALGSGRASLWRTTVREETEVDLFGEQTVLCGGMNALVTAAFDTLVAEGFTPEIAFLECVNQLKYLADLMHEKGISGMRRGISGTACYGDVTRGPRVIGPGVRAEMARILAEVRSGEFAREWAAEAAAGAPRLRSLLEDSAGHPIEQARRNALGLPDPEA